MSCLAGRLLWRCVWLLDAACFLACLDAYLRACCRPAHDLFRWLLLACFPVLLALVGRFAHSLCSAPSPLLLSGPPTSAPSRACLFFVYVSVACTSAAAMPSKPVMELARRSTD
ncbi:hypothetical protein HDK64DRAFT_275074 [Phyllosticta capitalensis]